METFNEKLALLLIDKVAIGVLIGIATFCASLMLERFKTAISFRSEMDKIRVQKMGELWDIFGQVNLQLGESISCKKRILEEEHVSLNSDIQGVAKERIISEVLPNIVESLKGLEQAYSTLETNRIWLGDRLYNIHLKHLNSLSQLSDQLTKGSFSNELTLLFERLKTILELNWNRIDFKKILREL